jgi:polysaccharide deacetylase 2 family uncharacterized protein YibQ
MRYLKLLRRLIAAGFIGFTVFSASSAFSQYSSAMNNAHINENNPAPHKAATPYPTIAIIIDDMGHHHKKGLLLVDMPHPMTFAFLPGRKHTQRLAKLAYQSGKEIMLHAPMETEHGFDLGKGALTQSMSKSEVQRALQESLGSIPFAIGVNNHMGSALTANQEIMNWVMQQISQSPVYFVDSRTSANSVAGHTAQQHNIPSLTRDIFLDHEQSEEYVATQFDRLIVLAKKQGTAIAIGHPHDVTIRFLASKLPELGEQGIALATVSGLWQIRNPYTAMFSEPSLKKNKAIAISGEF